MSRRKKENLRPLTQQEQDFLETLCHARSAPADQMARATGILAVAAGQDYQQAAALAGRKQGTTVAKWVARFNKEGLNALVPQHGGGHAPRFVGELKKSILATFERSPVLETDGTALWSISTLQKALQRESITISIYSLWGILREEGYSVQKDRSWCHTGEAKRKRKRNGQTVVEIVKDPDTDAKKN